MAATTNDLLLSGGEEPNPDIQAPVFRRSPVGDMPIPLLNGFPIVERILTR